MNTTDIIVFVSICVAAFLTVMLKKLDVIAAFAGVVVAFCMYVGGGLQAVLILATFFVAGTAATSHKKQLKQLNNKDEHVTGKRNVWQVLANSGVAAIVGLLMYVMPQHKTVLLLMMAASIASAASDTLSSELGTVYGKRFYNILTFKKDAKGLDGVISIEGLVAGVAGSALIAIVHVMFTSNIKGFLIVVIAGFAGNLFDSFLGATLQHKHILNNDAVNFLNTLMAAFIAFILLVV